MNMNMFQMTLTPDSVGTVKTFLKDNFVCMGWPGIGDLEHVDKDQLEERLAHVYKIEGQELANHLAEVSCFVHTMQDGDYLLLAADDWVHLGDLGDYYYIEHSDSAEDGMCHRRGVTWMKSMLRKELPMELQAFLNEGTVIGQFKRSVSHSELERWLSNSADSEAETGEAVRNSILVDVNTIEEAIQILRLAMKSDDVDRRERAAIALLQYAK